MKVTLETRALLKALDFLIIYVNDGRESTSQVFFKFIGGNQCQLFRNATSVYKASPIINCSCDKVSDKQHQVNYDALYASIQKIAMRFKTVTLFIEPTSNELNIEAGRLKTKLKLSQIAELEVNEARLEPQNEICVKTSELDRIIKRAKVASAQKDVRYVLNGVLITTDSDGVLRAVGCDGHRLSVAISEYLAHAYRERSLIISNSGVRYLETVIKQSTEERIVVHFDDTHLRVSLKNGGALKVSLIEGLYPEWRKVIPLETKSSVLIDRKEMIASILSAQPLANKGYRTAIFNIHKELTIKASSDVGEYIDVVESKEFHGEPLEINVNIDYLLAALESIHTNDVKLEFVSSSIGFLVREVGEFSNGIQMIMPVRR